MNRLARLVTVLLVSGMAAVAVTSADPAAPPSPDARAKDRVVRVYYFHTTQRCASCKKIEALSAEAVRTGFERELSDGRLEWQVVNIDDPSNKHFVQDYELYTKSLVVVDVANGRQVRWKNLPKIWELLQDEQGFEQYVQREIKWYLEGRS